MTSNRRNFLQATSALTVTALLSGMRSVHSQEADANKLANSKLNGAVIGTGGRGGSHIQGLLQTDNVSLTHICEVDSQIANKRASQIESKQGLRPQVVADVRKLLEDSSIDFVTVATPNHWHALAGVWATQVQLHVPSRDSVPQ
jgi:hypothetical protein